MATWTLRHEASSTGRRLGGSGLRRFAPSGSGCPPWGIQASRQPSGNHDAFEPAPRRRCGCSARYRLPPRSQRVRTWNRPVGPLRGGGLLAPIPRSVIWGNGGCQGPAHRALKDSARSSRHSDASGSGVRRAERAWPSLFRTPESLMPCEPGAVGIHRARQGPFNGCSIKGECCRRQSHGPGEVRDLTHIARTASGPPARAVAVISAGLRPEPGFLVDRGDGGVETPGDPAGDGHDAGGAHDGGQSRRRTAPSAGDPGT